MKRFQETLVLIRGAGDLASGVAARLHRCGFPVVMTELAAPLMVRRAVSFGAAVYAGETQVEGIAARCVADVPAALAALDEGAVPVLVDPAAACRHALRPSVVVDALVAKRNLHTRITDAPLVIALGPGFTAGEDCHAVIETMRGHWLGRVIWRGEALPDTGQPAAIAGVSAGRVLKAPTDGQFVAYAAIGDPIVKGQLIATVADQEIWAETSGILRGILHSGLTVHRGLKIGDIDPRAEREHCFTISDKSYTIAGGVLETILAQAQAK